jgi:hypothetical protein
VVGGRGGGGRGGNGESILVVAGERETMEKSLIGVEGRWWVLLDARVL